MNEFLRVQKWALSRSSLAKMSAQLILPEMCFIWTEKYSCWHSRTKFFSEIEVFETLSCCCFGSVAVCAVVVVDRGG